MIVTLYSGYSGRSGGISISKYTARGPAYRDVLPLGMPAVLIYRFLYSTPSVLQAFLLNQAVLRNAPNNGECYFIGYLLGRAHRPAEAPYSHASKCFDHLQLISQDAAWNELRIHTQSSCVCWTALLSLPRLLLLFGWIASARALFVRNDIMGQRVSFKTYGFCVPVSTFDLKVRSGLRKYWNFWNTDVV